MGNENGKYPQTLGRLEWAAIALATGIVAGTAAIISPEFRSFVADDSVAAWGAAIGALSAALAALHIAQQDRREKNRKEVMRAKLLAPRVAIRIAGVRSDLRVLYSSWVRSPDCFLDRNTSAQAAKWADEARNEFSMADLEILAASPTRCAEHLINSLAFLDMIHGILIREQPNPERHRAMVATALPKAGLAIESFEAARLACQTWPKW